VNGEVILLLLDQGSRSVSRDENAKFVFHHIFVKSESIYIKPKQK